MIAPREVRERAGQLGFPLATWEGTKVQPNQPLAECSPDALQS
jgi:hypothetical protein